MNKYELTVVVNAKIEDDVRVATVEKVKETMPNEELLYDIYLQSQYI